MINRNIASMNDIIDLYQYDVEIVHHDGIEFSSKVRVLDVMIVILICFYSLLPYEATVMKYLT